jgi:hypothetical protein
MTKLAKSHPFIIEALALEELELKVGLTDEIISRRINIARQYPEYYKEYMKVKGIKQEERLYRERIEKIKEMEERGCETISYYRNKIEEARRRNRFDRIQN